MNNLTQKLLIIKKKAYTLVELISVLGIVAIIMTVGFYAFFFFRNSLIVNNDGQKLKSVFRDAQNKALTFSVYNDKTGSSGFKNRWVYGYSLEYDTTTKVYRLYTVISNGNTIPESGTDTTELRNKWTTSGSTCVNNSTLGNLTFASGRGVVCNVESTFTLETTIATSPAPCNVFYSSVNGITTLKGASSSCNITFNKGNKNLTLTYYEAGSGDIKMCDGTSTCP